MDSITNLLRALAEAIRPYLGLDSIGAGDAGDIEGLDDHIEKVVNRYNRANDIAPLDLIDPSDIEGLDNVVEEAVDTYVSNDSSILTDTSFDPDDYDLITKDGFDPSRYDLLDETDTSYLIEERVENWVSSWAEDMVLGIDYASDEFLDAVEKAVRATLAGITFTVQANLCTSDDPTNHQGDTCPVHEGVGPLDGYSAVV